MKSTRDNNPNKNLIAGRLVGIILAIFGVIITLILLIIISKAKSLPRMLIAGPALLCLGLAMIACPGANYGYKELNKKTGKSGAKRIWTDAPLLHKLAWIGSIILGLIISFRIMTSHGFLEPL